MSLSAADYLAGWAFLAPTLALCVACGWLLVGRLAPELRGLTRGLAIFQATSAALVVAHLVPGAIGSLSRISVLLTALAIFGAARFAPAVDPEPTVAVADPLRAGGGLVFAAIGVAAATVGALAFLLSRVSVPVTAVDALTVHLPEVARWIQSGSYWDLVQYAAGLSNATYPQNGTLMLLAAVLPWESTFAVRYVDIPFLIALVLAIYAFARALGGPVAASALAAATVMTLGAVIVPGLDQAQVDAPMLAWFAVGALFLLRSARTGSRSDLLIAGCGLGLAFGTKWYAVPYVPVLALLWLWARRNSGARGKELWQPATTLAATITLFGGFWLVRNLILTGNPVHPAPVQLLGHTIFDAPRDLLREYAGFTVSDYLFDGGIWRDWFVPAYGANFGVAGPALIALGAAGALVLARASARANAAAATLVAALAMGALYTILPDTAFGPPGHPVLVAANARYLVPALIAGAAFAAWLAGTSERTGRLVEILLTAAILDGIYRFHVGVGLRHVAVAIAALAVVGALAGGFWLRRARPGALWQASAMTALVLLGGGWALPDGADPARYADLDPTLAWLDVHVPPGGRVALGGTWSAAAVSPVLPAFGPRLRNRVDYLGRFVEGTLQSWDRREPFQRQLRRSHYDAVIIGRGVPSRPHGEEPAATWARELGFRAHARSSHLVLLAPPVTVP